MSTAREASRSPAPIDVEVEAKSCQSAVSSTHNGRTAASIGRSNGVKDPSEIDGLHAMTAGLLALAQDWDTLNPADGSTVQELLRRFAELQQDMQACSLGDPAATTSITRHFCKDDVVKAHGDVTAANLEVDLARLRWELSSLRHQQGTSDSEQDPTECSLHVDMALLRLRQLDLAKARAHLADAASCGGFDPRLGMLARYCVQLLAPRSSDLLSGDFSAGSAVQGVSSKAREVFLAAGYKRDEILRVTGARSLSDFIFVDTQADTMERNLLLAAAEPNPMRPEEKEQTTISATLVDLIRVFLLHRVLPLARFTQLLGPDAVTTLLSLHVIAAVEGELCEPVSAEEAVAAVRRDPSGNGALYAFSNVCIWPLEDDLLIATDYEQTFSDQDVEPVMYISEDSSALVAAAPRVPARRVLDACCGCGVQGIVALRYYATEAMFVDLNPRAIRFTRFNLALNGLSQKCIGVHEGDVYHALPANTAPFDAILANPPFVPNPEGIASGAGAMFGNGGASGDEIMRSLVAGASRHLRVGGHLALVAMVPEVASFPKKLEQWYKASASSPFTGMVFYGPGTAVEQYLPTSSEVETSRYRAALQAQGIKSLSEVVMVLLAGVPPAEDSEPCASLCGDPRQTLWSDQLFLRMVVQRTVADPAELAEESSGDAVPMSPQPPSGGAPAVQNPLREGRLIGFQEGFFAAHCTQPTPEWAEVAAELGRIKAAASARRQKPQE